MPRGRKKKASSLELLTRHKGNAYKDTMLRELTQDEKAAEVESLNKVAEGYKRAFRNQYTATRTPRSNLGYLRRLRAPRSSLGYLRRLRESLDIVIRFMEISNEVVEGGEEQYD